MIKRIDASQVKLLLADEELFNRISDDSMTYDKFTPPYNGIYLGLFSGGDLAGFVWLIPDNAITFDFHINILADYRHESGAFSVEIYKYIVECYSGHINKLVCKIPTTFKDVYFFAKKHGFSDEGLDRQSVLKGGKILDRNILGITMQEIKTWVQ